MDILMMVNKYYVKHVIFNVAHVRPLVLIVPLVLDPIEELSHNVHVLHHIIMTKTIFANPVILSVKLVSQQLQIVYHAEVIEQQKIVFANLDFMRLI